MSKKLLVAGIGFLAAVAFGWEAAMIANPKSGFKSVTLAIPIIRFEKFDETRRALIVGLFNPGTLPIEINRTELIHEANDKITAADFVIKEYSDKPLVVDPGDTILVTLGNSQSFPPKTDTGSYWGKLDFRIPGHVDFYSLRHRFAANLYDDINHSAQN